MRTSDVKKSVDIYVNRPTLSVDSDKHKRAVIGLDFFARPAQVVARGLIGKYLVRRRGGANEAFIISEVEAYVGPQDLACHGSKGRTSRTEMLFGPAGHFYIYLCYGMHWMLNIVTDREDFPSAVLIRRAGQFDGPGKLTQALGIDGRMHGLRAEWRSSLWFEDRGEKVLRSSIQKTPRIGVAYAGVWAKKPLRFVVRSQL